MDLIDVLIDVKPSTWIVVIMMVATLMIGFVLSPSTNEEVLRAQQERKVWQTSPSGVRYYKDCMEGHIFLVTLSTHGYEQLAGPVGACE